VKLLREYLKSRIFSSGSSYFAIFVCHAHFWLRHKAILKLLYPGQVPMFKLRYVWGFPSRSSLGRRLDLATSSCQGYRASSLCLKTHQLVTLASCDQLFHHHTLMSSSLTALGVNTPDSVMSAETRAGGCL
jgi:hypothetical protein